MKRIFLAAVLFAVSAMATDFSQMTTEELVALRGSVAVEEQSAFQEELQSRLSALSVEERQELLGTSGTQTHSRAMDALNGDFGGAESMGLGVGSQGGIGNGHGGGHGGMR